MTYASKETLLLDLSQNFCALWKEKTFKIMYGIFSEMLYKHILEHAFVFL